MAERTRDPQRAITLSRELARARVIDAAKAWVKAQEDDQPSQDALVAAVLALREAERRRR